MWKDEKIYFLIVFLISHAFAVSARSLPAALPKQAVTTLLVGHAKTTTAGMGVV
jgi:hypothetical protein